MSFHKLMFWTFTTIIIYLAYNNDEGLEVNSKRGVLAAMLFIAMIGSLKPSDPFGEKYGAIFRIQLWLSVTFIAILVFLGFQNEKDGRYLMSLGDHRLGKPVTKDMHTYDDNCEFEWINIVDNLDHYYWGHVINWLLATFLVRDFWFLNFWSVLDEIIELSWQHKLPHFRECWWDHVLLDVLLSNTVAIIVGMFIIKKFKFQQYSWFAKDTFTNPKKFEAVLIVIIVIIGNFLNNFFLMNQLWVPPKCWMVVYRLLIWFMLGHSAFRELHNSITDSQQSYQLRYLTYFTIVIETLISIKFLPDCGNLQNENTPIYIWLPWFIVALLSFLWWIKLQLAEPKKSLKPPHQEKNRKEKKKD
ncbi:unnamed protein product [Paramecium sonneborni]|uniref:Phosphatidylserine synthase n=1 Tax=Paramecium sonneborni TaxID=65129 RepID=A0A8S1KDZ2_9CILI|nr:unnamed protein product [Paramecium sonneborni]